MFRRTLRKGSTRWLCAALLAASACAHGFWMSGTSVEVLPVSRWDFNGPRTLSMIALGPEGSTSTPIARITTVGCLQFWTPLQ